jgi:hypothetical protein
MMRVWSVILFAAATVAAVSCDDPEIQPPTQLNLDRPVDISFACYGPMRDTAAGTIAETAQPPRWCNSYSPLVGPADLAGLPRPPGLETGETPKFSWYGFVLQPSSGTVVLSRFSAKPSNQFVSGLSTNITSDVRVDDADPRTPGKNAISVGENPVAIGTDRSGCHEVTANAGSCDLSVLDINSAIAFGNNVATQAIVNRQIVLKVPPPVPPDPAVPPVPLRARPAAMVMQPSAPDVVVGEACPAKPSGIAYVAYPGCNLVAAVDLETSAIRHGIQFNGTVPTLLGEAEIAVLPCVNECNGEAPAAAMLASLRPSSLDLVVDVPGKPTRLVIGADNSSVITVVELDPATFAPAPAPVQVQLEDPTGKLGVTAVAMSPQINMGNSTVFPRENNNSTVGDGPPPGEVGQYVYAVATDESVRVVDVLRARECETQVDMRFVRGLAADPANIPALQCFPIGDPRAPRRSGAKGPGIELPVDGAPTSVTIVKGLDKPLTTTTPVLDADGKQVVDGEGKPVTQQVPNATSPAMLIGYFAFITTSGGQVFIVNVDDDDGPDLFVPSSEAAPTSAQATQPVLVMAHQLRDSFSARGDVPATTANKCTASDPASVATGGPRATTAPAPLIAPDTLSNVATQANKSLGLPNVRKQACSFADAAAMPPVNFNGTVSELQIGADPAIRDEVFPDLRASRSETWTLTWEGTLSNDSLLANVDGPPIRHAQMLIDPQGIRLIDQSRPFCDIGVEPFDIVQLRGCNPVNLGTDCPRNYTCFVHEDNPVNGLGACMLESEASRLSVACKDFLVSARRYTVAQAESGELTLHPRKHVLSTTPVDGCVSNEQCSELASHALALRSEKHPFELTGVNKITDPHTWQCVVDPLRAPVNGDPTLKRCVEVCAVTEQCEAGSVCIGATGTLDGNNVLVKDGTCMESVLPPQSCVNGLQRFDVHASEAFTMIGLRSGYVHPVVEKGGDGADKHACVIPDASGSVQRGRIPLQAPACDLAADKSTGALTGGGFEANPCSTTVTHTEDRPNYLSVDPADPQACVASTVEPLTVPVTRTDVPAIKIRTRSMTLTLVDPYSPGDLVCAGDRLGSLGKIPHMVPAPFDTPNWFAPNYQLLFEERAGYGPLALSQMQITPAFPVKVVRGPGESVWIMDDGDFLATQPGQSSTKGQVFRVEVSSLTTVNILR